MTSTADEERCVMEGTIIFPYWLAILFIVVAFFYSSVGLGGGSSYTALLAIVGVNFLVIPTISLTLNLLVTSVGSFNYIRERHARFRLVGPFLVSSIPMSYIGGALDLSRESFYWILLISLVFIALRIYVWDRISLKLEMGKAGQTALSLGAGSALGLTAGIAGIGGGIYLVPLILILGLGTQKEAAACGAIFVWVNSLSGLTARFSSCSLDWAPFVPLIVAVLAGSALGSFMGSSRFSPRTMQKMLGAIVLVAIIFLSRKMLIL